MELPDQGPPVPVTCIPLDDEDEEKNDPGADRVNVVFAPSESRLDDVFPGASWMTPDDLLPYAKEWRRTLETIAPFSQEQMKKKIQYWYVPEDMTDREASHTIIFFPEWDWTPCSLSCLTKPFYCSNLSEDFPPSPTVKEVFYSTESPPFHDNVSYTTVCGVSCSSHASLVHNVTYTSVAQPGVPLKYGKYIWSHEQQHAQFKERDEYDYPDGPEMAGLPNCAPNLAVANQWKAKYPEIPFLSERVPGCSYVASPHVRFTQSSLMRGGVQPEAIKLERVNEAWALLKLSAFSGDIPPQTSLPSPLLPSLPSPLRFIAQLLGMGKENTSAEEPALEVRLKRTGDGAYEIVDIRAMSVPNGVKPTFDDGGVVTARVGDRTFTQTFSSNGVNIAEAYDDVGKPFLVGYGENPVEKSTVLVGLGDTRVTDDGLGALLPDGSVVPIEVAVALCSDIDENMENDCPKPMFRGEDLPPPPIEEILGEPTQKPSSEEILSPVGEPEELEDEEQRMEQPSEEIFRPVGEPEELEPPSPPSPEPHPAAPASSRMPFLLFISGLFAIAALGGFTYGWRKLRNRWGEGA